MMKSVLTEVCESCGHLWRYHTTGGMCQGTAKGIECYCSMLPQSRESATSDPARVQSADGSQGTGFADEVSSLRAQLAAADARAAQVEQEFERVGIPANGQIDGSVPLWQIQQARFRWEAAESRAAQLAEENAALIEDASINNGAATEAEARATQLQQERDQALESYNFLAEHRADEHLQVIAPEWAEAANAARGLCESEANKWEHTSPSTSAHWRSVAVRLGAMYLAQDHLGTSSAESILTALRASLTALAATWREKAPPTYDPESEYGNAMRACADELDAATSLLATKNEHDDAR